MHGQAPCVRTVSKHSNCTLGGPSVFYSLEKIKIFKFEQVTSPSPCSVYSSGELGRERMWTFQKRIPLQAQHGPHFPLSMQSRVFFLDTCWTRHRLAWVPGWEIHGLGKYRAKNFKRMMGQDVESMILTPAQNLCISQTDMLSMSPWMKATWNYHFRGQPWPMLILSPCQAPLQEKCFGITNSLETCLPSLLIHSTDFTVCNPDGTKLFSVTRRPGQSWNTPAFMITGLRDGISHQALGQRGIQLHHPRQGLCQGIQSSNYKDLGIINGALPRHHMDYRVPSSGD